MRLPLSWLRDFAPIDQPLDEIVATLNDLGLAVESVERVGEGLDGVVVARVLEIGAIPKADKIRRVVVDAGGEPVQIVCGAWNFEEGDLVPLATVGSVLPGDFAISARKMKGVESHGMICAADELGLPGGTDGILVLPEGLEVGTPFADAMGITVDVVVDLEVNANRPDAMSVAGVARDLAARLGLPFSIPTPKPAEAAAAGTATVEVEAPELCGRFVAQVVAGISVGPSPAWLANRLTLAGMRPINNVVDASNYVMLELGQPTHPYDLARLPGRGLRVRRAREGEVLVTLDDAERRLGPDDLLICDADDVPVGIAGIMGGASSEIDAATTEVLLEAAWFDPMAVSRTSRRLKLRTEASARFEKGCDWEVPALATARFCELLAASGAVAAGPPVDVAGQVPDRTPVRVRTDRVNAILGTDLSATRIRDLLGPIGFTAETAGDDHDVTIPSWRPDSATEIDVIEEVARLHGYSAVPKTVPTSTLTGALTAHQHDRRLVRQILAGAGASEAWSTTFLSADAIRRCGLDVDDAVVVANPLVADEGLLRPSLLPGLLTSVAYNAGRRQRGVHLFEVGNVFRRPPVGQDLPVEREMVAVALAGCDATEAVGIWSLLIEGLLLEGACIETATAPGLHPTRTARVVVGGTAVGALGEIDPGVLEASGIDERVAWLEVDLEALLAAPHGSASFRPVSRYPSSDIDLAFEVDDAVPATDIESTLRAAGGDLVAGVWLFDVYRGAQVPDGRRSLAYTVRFQAPDHTLTDDDVAAVRGRLIEAVEDAHPATLRA
ncbi:MAG TPA: phenylalanine--tRNA ligase subunit beta [Acidimicrobiales bacterium]|nr:phenylalanine--tRNA ligase subunit beta [Acidimicrobiales bacterium]